MKNSHCDAAVIWEAVSFQAADESLEINVDNNDIKFVYSKSVLHDGKFYCPVHQCEAAFTLSSGLHCRLQTVFRLTVATDLCCVGLSYVMDKLPGWGLAKEQFHGFQHISKGFSFN